MHLASVRRSFFLLFPGEQRWCITTFTAPYLFLPCRYDESVTQFLSSITVVIGIKLLDVPQRELRKQCPSSRKSCWWRVTPGKLYVATSIVALKWTSCTGMFGVVTIKNLFIVSSLTLFPYFSCLLFPNFIGDRVNPRARHYRYHSEWVCLKANIPPTLTARLFSFIVVSFPSQRRNLHIRSVM